MKTYSKAELAGQAKTHFENLSVSKLFATSDGQFFVTENRALLHAGAGGVVYPILSEDAAEDAAKAMGIMDLFRATTSTNDLAELQAMMATEVGGANRTEAMEIIETRIQMLLHDKVLNHADPDQVVTATGEALRAQPDAIPVGTEPTAAQQEAAAVKAAPATAPQEATPPNEPAKEEKIPSPADKPAAKKSTAKK